MTCTRCQGCMAKDHFIDLMESAESMWLAVWRCLNCGNVFDPVVEKNRPRGGEESPRAGNGSSRLNRTNARP